MDYSKGAFNKIDNYSSREIKNYSIFLVLDEGEK